MAKMSDGELLAYMGTDAEKWANEFTDRLGGDPTPGGQLFTWICNAIEAGRSAGYAQAKKEDDPGWPVSDACRHCLRIFEAYASENVQARADFWFRAAKQHTAEEHDGWVKLWR